MIMYVLGRCRVDGWVSSLENVRKEQYLAVRGGSVNLPSTNNYFLNRMYTRGQLFPFHPWQLHMSPVIPERKFTVQMQLCGAA